MLVPIIGPRWFVRSVVIVVWTLAVIYGVIFEAGSLVKIVLTFVVMLIVCWVFTGAVRLIVAGASRVRS
jgi:hypothetical protein